MDPNKFNQRPSISSRRPASQPAEPTPAPQPVQPSAPEPEVIKDKLLNKKNIIIGSVVIFVILAGLTLLFINLASKSHQVDVHKTDSATCPSTPAYSTLTPGGVSIDKLGGWKPVCPPGSTPTYAFTDQVANTQVVVTEQKLPKDLQKNTSDKIKDIAKNYNATDKLSTDSLTAYIGTNADGPQSIIATNGELLILIQSKSSAANSDWVDYLDSFKSID